MKTYADLIQLSMVEEHGANSLQLIKFKRCDESHMPWAFTQSFWASWSRYLNHQSRGTLVPCKPFRDPANDGALHSEKHSEALGVTSPCPSNTPSKVQIHSAQRCNGIIKLISASDWFWWYCGWPWLNFAEQAANSSYTRSKRQV